MPASVPALTPVATGPRLQVGDILVIGSRECRVESILRGGRTAVVVPADHVPARPFQVSSTYAMRHRRSAPRLPHTAATINALRKGIEPPGALLNSAIKERLLDAVDRQGQTALLLAARHGHCAVVEALLSHCACVDFAPVGGETALIQAARHGHEHVVAALLNARCAIDAIGLANGRSALLEASAAGHLDVCLRLLARGANVHIRERTRARHDALDLAIACGRLGVAKKLACWGDNAHALSRRRLGLCPSVTTAGMSDWLRRSASWGTALHHVRRLPLPPLPSHHPQSHARPTVAPSLRLSR